MTDELTITFGKYKGEKVDAVPASYLLWCADQDWISRYSKLENYINKNKKDLEKDAAAEEYIEAPDDGDY